MDWKLNIEKKSVKPKLSTDSMQFIRKTERFFFSF